MTQGRPARQDGFDLIGLKCCTQRRFKGAAVLFRHWGEIECDLASEPAQAELARQVFGGGDIGPEGRRRRCIGPSIDVDGHKGAGRFHKHESAIAKGNAGGLQFLERVEHTKGVKGPLFGHDICGFGPFAPCGDMGAVAVGELFGWAFGVGPDEAAITVREYAPTAKEAKRLRYDRLLMA